MWRQSVPAFVRHSKHPNTMRNKTLIQSQPCERGGKKMEGVKQRRKKPDIRDVKKLKTSGNFLPNTRQAPKDVSGM